jgi:hypothetical protein
MFNHLLVVLETDSEDNDALAYATRMARASGARLTLLRLLDPSFDKSRFVDPLDWHLRKLEVKLNLEELRQKLRKAESRARRPSTVPKRRLLHYAQARGGFAPCQANGTHQRFIHVASSAPRSRFSS